MSHSTTANDSSFTVRRQLRAHDVKAVCRIVTENGFFHAFEINIAVELAEESLRRGDASGYHFIFIDDGQGQPVAYACFGEIPCTAGSFDLYWIAVDPAHQRSGLGRRLMTEVEAVVAAQRGRRIYIETSARPLYQPTIRFYQHAGYTLAATLPDFYAPGDAKLIFSKTIAITPSP
jgi:D-alanine-D-alanine ligase